MHSLKPGGGGTRKRLLNELPSLLRGIPPIRLLGGDLNSVLRNLDGTGHTIYSRVMQEFIRSFGLVDMCKTSKERATYTHYTSWDASRIDRIYASRNMGRQKWGAETRIAAFTDNLAVVIRITLEATNMRCGRNYWKTNAALLLVEILLERLRQCWQSVQNGPKSTLPW